MTDPIKRICDAIMYLIAQQLAEATNPSGKKFGRKMLHEIKQDLQAVAA